MTTRSPINFPAELTARFRSKAAELFVASPVKSAALLVGLLDALDCPREGPRLRAYLDLAHAELELEYRTSRAAGGRARGVAIKSK